MYRCLSSTQCGNESSQDNLWLDEMKHMILWIMKSRYVGTFGHDQNKITWEQCFYCRLRRAERRTIGPRRCNRTFFGPRVSLRVPVSLCLYVQFCAGRRVYVRECHTNTHKNTQICPDTETHTWSNFRSTKVGLDVFLCAWAYVCAVLCVFGVRRTGICIIHTLKT